MQGLKYEPVTYHYKRNKLFRDYTDITDKKRRALVTRMAKKVMVGMATKNSTAATAASHPVKTDL